MSKQQKIELKNIKYAAFASEETHCYDATLYLDGKAMFRVGNDGHGGCDAHHRLNQKQSREAYDAAQDSVAEALWNDLLENDKEELIRSCTSFLRHQGDAAIPDGWYQSSSDELLNDFQWTIKAAENCKTMVMFSPLESRCCDLVNDWHVMKDIKRDLRGKCVFVCDDLDGIRILGYKGGAKAMKKFGDGKLREAMSAKYKNVRFVADMKPEEQLALYRG